MDKHWVITGGRFPLLICLEGATRIYIAKRLGKEISVGDYVEGKHFAIGYSSSGYTYTLASFGEEKEAVDEIKGMAFWLKARTIKSTV